MFPYFGLGIQRRMCQFSITLPLGCVGNEGGIAENSWTSQNSCEKACFVSRVWLNDLHGEAEKEGCFFQGFFLFPKDPTIEKSQSRLIAWNFKSCTWNVQSRLASLNLAWNIQSRLKITLPTLIIPHEKGPYFQSRLKLSVSLETFNLRLVAWKRCEPKQPYPYLRLS